jgi:hypothetical protein
MEEFEKKRKHWNQKWPNLIKMAEFDKQMEPFNAKMKIFEKMDV